RYATRRQFVEREIPCATPEGLVLLKLYALPSLYRQGNLARVALYETDILMLMDRQKVDVEPLFMELAPHLSPTDLASLRRITDEIRQRIDRFGGRFAHIRLDPRQLDPVQVAHRPRVFHRVAGVEGRGGLEEEDLDLLLGHRAVLHA